MKKIFLTGFFLTLFLGHAYGQAKIYDYVIKNALIYDGISLRPQHGDVGIIGDRIVSVGAIDAGDAHQVVDGTHRILTPGFIDVHTHSDFNPLLYPDLPNKIRQGVTTEVVGNCGMSAAPVFNTHAGKISGIWRREGVMIPEQVPWQTFAQYRTMIENSGLITNFVPLIGHGNLRSSVMGFGPEKATAEQLDGMQKMLGQAMNQGAQGISFGLVYLPGVFADSEEITELCREAGRLGGICAFHMRNEGSAMVEAVEEVLSVARNTGAAIQISHLKAGGSKNWDKIHAVIQRIQEARQQGLKVLADIYPYTASFAELGVILPDSFYKDENRVTLFQEESPKGRLLAHLKEYYHDTGRDWSKVMVATVKEPEDNELQGRTIREIADSVGREPEEILIDLLARNKFEVGAFYFSQSEEVISQLLKQPFITIGSDSIADGSNFPHPRAFGTFPKLIREYVLSQEQLSFGQAVVRMTSLAANHFGLDRRGRVVPDYYADLVLMDSVRIRDRATYGVPANLSEGIDWVFVNGQPVIQEGRFTGEKSGHFLARIN